MKEYKMDEFFREKLANRKETPSENAWIKLSGELNKGKKKKAMVYWSVAAGILLLLGLGLVFFNQATTDEIFNPIVENSDPLNSEEVLIPSENDQQLTEIPKEREVKKIEQVEVQVPVKNNEVALYATNRKVDQNKENNSKVEITVQEELTAEIEQENLIKPETPIIQPEVKETSELLAYQQSKIETEEYPEIIITYKKASTQEKPEKAFKKIVKLARDIKEGEYGLGQLREAKNELLAFEKKKD